MYWLLESQSFSGDPGGMCVWGRFSIPKSRICHRAQMHLILLHELLREAFWLQVGPPSFGAKCNRFVHCFSLGKSRAEGWNLQAGEQEMETIVQTWDTKRPLISSWVSSYISTWSESVSSKTPEIHPWPIPPAGGDLWDYWGGWRMTSIDGVIL